MLYRGLVRFLGLELVVAFCSVYSVSVGGSKNCQELISSGMACRGAPMVSYQLRQKDCVCALPEVWTVDAMGFVRHTV